MLNSLNKKHIVLVLDLVDPNQQKKNVILKGELAINGCDCSRIRRDEIKLEGNVMSYYLKSEW